MGSRHEKHNQRRNAKFKRYVGGKKLGADSFPCWRLDQVDPGFPDARTHVTADWLAAMAQHLARYEQLTWTSIEDGSRTKCHDVIPISRDEVLARIVHLGLPEETLLFQLGEPRRPERVFGIRAKSEFSILWWDPEHRVFPRDGDKKRK